MAVSTSRALPVLRTADLQAAYEAARRLLDLVIPLKEFVVSAEAQARTLEEARRMAEAFPDSRISPIGPPEPGW